MDFYTKLVLSLIAAFLGLLAWERLSTPAPASAQADQRDLYIEPGYTVLRKLDGTASVLGKVVIDRKTGDIWGFPTGNELPYPLTPTKNEPPVSKPMYLGRYAFEQMNPPR